MDNDIKLTKQRKEKKPKSMAFRNAVAGYLFTLPFIIGFLLFLLVPLMQSLRMV